MPTILAYGVTFASALFGLTQLPSFFTTLFLGKLTGPTFAQFVGTLISWTIISALWQRFLGQTIPVFALAGAIALILYHLKVASTRLTLAAKSGMFMEIWAIVVVGIWDVVEAKTIHWL